MVYLRIAYIPNDATVYLESSAKFKTNKIILSDKYNIKEWLQQNNYNSLLGYYYDTVEKNNSIALEYYLMKDNHKTFFNNDLVPSFISTCYCKLNDFEKSKEYFVLFVENKIIKTKHKCELCYKLARLCKIKKNIPEALYYYEQNLQFIEQYNNKTNQEPDKYIPSHLDTGNIYYEIANLYETKHDFTKYEEYMIKGLSYNNSTSKSICAYKLGNYYKSVKNKDPIKYYKIAADLGHHTALREMSAYYDANDDYENAIKYLKVDYYRKIIKSPFECLEFRRYSNNFKQYFKHLLKNKFGTITPIQSFIDCEYKN